LSMMGDCVVVENEGLVFVWSMMYKVCSWVGEGGGCRRWGGEGVRRAKEEWGV